MPHTVRGHQLVESLIWTRVAGSSLEVGVVEEGIGSQPVLETQQALISSGSKQLKPVQYSSIKINVKTAALP